MVGMAGFYALTNEFTAKNKGTRRCLCSYKRSLEQTNERVSEMQCEAEARDVYLTYTSAPPTKQCARRRSSLHAHAAHVAHTTHTAATAHAAATS